MIQLNEYLINRQTREKFDFNEFDSFEDFEKNLKDYNMDYDIVNDYLYVNIKGLRYPYVLVGKLHGHGPDKRILYDRNSSPCLYFESENYIIINDLDIEQQSTTIKRVKINMQNIITIYKHLDEQK